MVFFHWYPVVKYSLWKNSFRHPSTYVSTVVAMDFLLAWYNSTQKLLSLVATFSTQFQDWSQEAQHELHPSGSPVTQTPSCWLVKAAGNRGFPISRHKESSSSKCVRTWGKIRQLGFQNPNRFKESSSCALGWRRRHRRRETLFSCRKKSMLNTVRFAIVASFSRWSQRTRPQVRHKSHIINKSKEKLQTNLINIACLNLVVVIILVTKILSVDQPRCSNMFIILRLGCSPALTLSSILFFGTSSGRVFRWVAKFITRYLSRTSLSCHSFVVHLCSRVFYVSDMFALGTIVFIHCDFRYIF